MTVGDKLSRQKNLCRKGFGLLRYPLVTHFGHIGMRVYYFSVCQYHFDKSSHFSLVGHTKINVPPAFPSGILPLLEVFKPFLRDSSHCRIDVKGRIRFCALILDFDEN